MKLPTLHLPFALPVGLADIVGTDRTVRDDTEALSLVMTTIDEHGWRVYEATQPTVAVGFIRSDADRFAVQFEGHAEALYLIDSFDAALDFFAEYAWASRLGLTAS